MPRPGIQLNELLDDMATETQLRALQIIRSNEIERPGHFARLMWPDAEAWQRPAKCGNHGVSKGGGMRMAGGAYLGKLQKAGLVEWYTTWPNRRLYRLTPAGESQLSSNA